MSNYDDIINKQRPFSKRNKMPISNRAFQFFSFNALNGYEEIISEIGRYVNSKKELTEDELIDLDYNLQIVLTKDKPLIEVIYFKKDLKKKGGTYLNYQGYLKKIDDDNNLLFVDKMKIAIKDVCFLKEVNY